ncbi:MAG: hypothetical protein M1821_002950 [Bathelium mastoideum]|nr:MAG: hypothetical protein M1821_002950 [Bathelium mastoideum]
MDSSYEDQFLPVGVRPAGMGPPAGYRPQDSHGGGPDMPGSFPMSAGRDELHLPGNGYTNAPRTSQRRKNSRPTDTAGASPMDLDIPSEHDIRKARNESAPRSPAGRERSRTHGGRRGSGSTRICGKCQGQLTGQFVRALENTYHLECFTCHDCNKIVASKFFPVPDQPPNQYPLCEIDYFRRLDLLCYECGGALRGSYITALDRKYHIEHFTCSVCPTVFGAQDSYYEHEGNVYCHYHYSTRFAQRCNGCQTSILKQFVEIFRNGQNQHWHPECYMIHKYWNVRLHSSGQPVAGDDLAEEDATEEMRALVRNDEEKVEEKVLWIWRTLSNFEERSATCISDMLLHVSNGAYVDGVMAAKKFIIHVEMLFSAADGLDSMLTMKTPKGLSYSREAKLLCKKVVAFFGLLRESQTTGVRRLGVTQELLSLVTGLAHYLKLLIRICLQGALKLERETGSQDGLQSFLEQVNLLEERMDADEEASSWSNTSGYVSKSADTCPVCDKPVEDKCVRSRTGVFHTGCMACQKCERDLGSHVGDARWSENSSRLLCRDCSLRVPDVEGGFEQTTRLMQYVHLLKVAHARLLATLRTSGALPHTSDDPNLTRYDSNQGLRLTPTGEPVDISDMRLASRSKSYAGESKKDDEQRPTYEQTLGDIRRLRSTRMDKHLSQTMKKARTSRIIDGPEGATVRPGSSGEGTASRTNNFQIVQDREANGDVGNQLSLGNNNSITLDDIPRLVAAEQAKEQRPNASKYARGPMIPQEPKPKLVNGHRRDFSGAQDLEKAEAQYRGKRYFSELSALEYFIIRHVAVLSMEPLLDGAFNQEELLEMIETKRSPTFWGKFGKAFGAKEPGQKKQHGKKKTGVFGVPLDQIVERDGAESTDGVGPGALRVPALVQDAVSAMRTMDMSVEGVFRKNGNIKKLKEMSEEIDAKGGDAVDLNRESPVQIAALLKKFLRALPDPVLTFKLHRLFIQSQQITDAEKRRRVLHLSCCLLPKAHRDTMEVLFCFLNWVASFSHVDEESGSKMDIHNLATVMAPNILFSNSKMQGMDDSFLAIEAIHSLIEFNETMCEIPEDLQSILQDHTLFETSQEITTKEILRRYADLRHVPQHTFSNTQNVSASAANAAYSPAVGVQPETPTSASYQPREGKGSIMRVEPDTVPQSSVRHVAHDVGGESYASDADYGAPNVPYARDDGPRGSSESQRSGRGAGSKGADPGGGVHRMSAFVRQQGLGVAGAG